MENQHRPRAAITGAAGFVGFALTQLLSERWGVEKVQAIVGPVQHATEQGRLDRLKGMGVRVIESDLREMPVLKRELQDFDVFFHLAAYVRTEENSRDVRINDQGTARLLDELGERLRGKRFVYSSTIAAVDLPSDGGRMTMATPCRPRTEYGATKLAAESIVKSAAAKIGFDYVTLRLPTVYGPGYRPGGMFDTLAGTLPHGALSARINWPGKMSIVAVNDLAEILLSSATCPEMSGETFLVSTNEDPTMGEIAREIATVLDVPHKPVELPSWFSRSLGVFKASFWNAQWVPHFVRIMAWRLSLVNEGLYADGSELTQLLAMNYTPWREGFRIMYGKQSKGDRKVVARMDR